MEKKIERVKATDVVLVSSNPYGFKIFAEYELHAEILNSQKKGMYVADLYKQREKLKNYVVDPVKEYDIVDAWLYLDKDGIYYADKKNLVEEVNSYRALTDYKSMIKKGLDINTNLSGGQYCDVSNIQGDSIDVDTRLSILSEMVKSLRQYGFKVNEVKDENGKDISESVENLTKDNRYQDKGELKNGKE